MMEVFNALKQLKLLKKKTNMDGSNSVGKLVKRIAKKMTANGIKCEKGEVNLRYSLNNRAFKARFWPSKSSGYRAVIIELISLDIWEKITDEGRSLWVNQINRNNLDMKVFSLDDSVVCQYTTFIKKPADFVDEAKRGYDVFGETMNSFYDKLSEMEQQYAVREPMRPIGFLRNMGSVA